MTYYEASDQGAKSVFTVWFPWSLARILFSITMTRMTRRNGANGTYYHPTFLYESLWSLLGFILIVTIRNRKQLLRQEEVALSDVLWYLVDRFFIEGMRTNSLWIGEWIHVSQTLSLPLFIGAIVVWFIRRQDYPPISYYSDGNKGQKMTIKMVN